MICLMLRSFALRGDVLLAAAACGQAALRIGYRWRFRRAGCPHPAANNAAISLFLCVGAGFYPARLPEMSSSTVRGVGDAAPYQWIIGSATRIKASL